MLEAQASALFEALSEPALVVSRDGTVQSANRPAKRLLGSDILGQPLADLAANDRADLELYLARCFGSGQPLIGSLRLQADSRASKIQCKGSVINGGEERAVLLRLSQSGDQPFAALTRTVAELRGELRKRQRSEAMLHEAVRERELLLRELEHRVKNNMHMLSAMLSGAEREAASAEAKAALKDASLRFAAVSAVQQLLYRSDKLATIDSQALVATLIGAVSTIAREAIETETAVDPIELPIDSAVPIGLILNELVTNAIKYGQPDEGTQKLIVRFVRNAGQVEIVVHDNGPGFDLSESSKRASGIGLVRGLLRQLGGALRVERENGARCVISFPEPANGAAEREE